MTTTEKVSVILGAAVSLMTLVGSVWYAAISFNNLSVAIDRYSQEMVTLTGKVEEKKVEHELIDKRLYVLENNQKVLIGKTLMVVHIGKNSVILSSSGGETIKLPILSTED